jgi:hypothetical protein
MNDSSALLKSILGDRGYETLKKAVYKQRTQAVIDPLEFYLPLIVAPRTILSWLIQTIKPMKPGEKIDVKFPGRDDIDIHIEKQDVDQYRAEFTGGGRILHTFEKQSLPAASAHMMTVGELYDSFGEPKKTDESLLEEERKNNPEMDEPKKESYGMIQHMMHTANIQPTEDPENVKWTMSHASIQEMTAVIGKLVDALTAKQLSRNKLESEIDKAAESESASGGKDMAKPMKKEAIKTTEIVTDPSKSGHKQEIPATTPKKDPVGMARTDEPHGQTPFKPGTASPQQSPETPFKKEAIKTNEQVSDPSVQGHEQKPSEKPKKDPVGMARTDEPREQTPFKPGKAEASQKPETPFKKEDAPMTPTPEDTSRHRLSPSDPSPHKTTKPNSYFRKKHEILTKPYVSDAQRRWAHTDAGTKALGGESHVHEWDESSKGKKLPEHVKKDAMSPTKPLAGQGTGAPSTPTSRPNNGFGAVVAKVEGPKGAGMPTGPGAAKPPKGPVPASNAPAAAAAKQAQQAGKGVVKPPKMAGMPKMPNPMAAPKQPKAPGMMKGNDYFRSKLGKSEELYAHATEEQLYKSTCQNCGVPEFVKGDDGNPKYNPCACFLITKKDEEGKPNNFVKLLRKNDGSYGLEFMKGADPETVKLFLLTLKARLLIKRKHGL